MKEEKNKTFICIVPQQKKAYAVTLKMGADSGINN